MHLVSRSLCVLLAAASAAGAQTTQDTTRRTSEWSRALVVGLPGTRSEMAPIELMTLGLQLTQLRPGRLSGDFAIGMLPYGLMFGAVIFGARGGVTLPMQAAPDLYWLPAAGVSTLGGLAADLEGGSLGTTGYTAGIGILKQRSDGGLRLNVSWHRFADVEESVWLAEVGFLLGRRSSKPRR